MTELPLLDIPELGQDEIQRFQSQHLPEELYDFIIDNFIRKLDMIKDYAISNNRMEGRKKKFNSYVIRIRNFYKAVLWNRNKLYDTFLQLYRFCEDNKEMCEDFASFIKESIKPVSNILKEA